MCREDELYEKWLRWLDRIDNEVTQLALDRFVYERLGEITHEAKLPASYVFEAFQNWYVRSQTTGVRRQCEVHPDAASLATLLDQIRRHPNVLTRSRYVGFYPAEAHWSEYANAAFNRLAGAGAETIPTDRVDADVERLADAARPVKRYVDRIVAHWDQRGLAEFAPTFGELNAAIDVIGDVFADWHQWLTARSRAEMVPVFQYDWEAPFRKAWSPEEG